MFSSIGWSEVFFILLLGLIIVGPERLPKVVEDFRAAIYAARKAIKNAKAELNEDMGDVTKEFEEFRKPMNTIASYTRMGPKAAFTKALLDDDDTFLDSFDPKKIMEETTAGQAYRAGGEVSGQQVVQPPQQTPGNSQKAQPASPQSNVDSTPPNTPAPGQPRTSYSWEDLI